MSVGAGAFVYFGADPAGAAGLVEAAVEVLESGLGLTKLSQMSLYRMPFHQGKWRGYARKAVDEALANADVAVINLRVGSPDSPDMVAKLQVRSDPDPHRAPTGPRSIGFVCETRAWTPDVVVAVGRQLLEAAARLGSPISGGVFRAPTFHQGHCEIGDTIDYDPEAPAFRDRMSFDRKDYLRWEKARRLYPVTLLGPKLASQVTADQATAAGAIAVQEINGSLLIDAYPTIVETWDPEFLRATLELRRWLWPNTIQNPADNVGLGFKTRR
ncbi:MAG: hypothetical protein K8W52_10235 [Deltaproteobacteria bacterium]|nr:hypothetical protein [Deltaproteobacteria bacterium]